MKFRHSHLRFRIGRYRAICLTYTSSSHTATTHHTPHITSKPSIVFCSFTILTRLPPILPAACQFSPVLRHIVSQRQHPHG